MILSQYFENRELRNALDQADLDSEVAKGILQDAIAKRREAEIEVNALTQEVNRLVKKLDKANEKIRDQTGADLLVNALRELGVVPKPEKHNDSFAEEARLRAQLDLARAGWSRGTVDQQLGLQQGSADNFLSGFTGT